VVEAEKATKKQVSNKGKTKGKGVLYEVESDKDIEEEVEDQSESDIWDCIMFITPRLTLCQIQGLRGPIYLERTLCIIVVNAQFQNLKCMISPLPFSPIALKRRKGFLHAVPAAVKISERLLRKRIDVK
jgi:hypothetical protein